MLDAVSAGGYGVAASIAIAAGWTCRRMRTIARCGRVPHDCRIAAGPENLLAVAAAEIHLAVAAITKVAPMLDMRTAIPVAAAPAGSIDGDVVVVPIDAAAPIAARCPAAERITGAERNACRNNASGNVTGSAASNTGDRPDMAKPRRRRLDRNTAHKSFRDPSAR